MVQKNRRDRRAANRKPIFTAVLLAVVAVVSFGIGFMAGRNSSPEVPAEVLSSSQRQPITATKPAPTVDVVEERIQDDKLTFFEALPKGEQPPLGSGINVPPEEKDPVAAKIAQQTVDVAPVPAPTQPTPVAVAASPKPAVKTAKVNADTPHVLQISSFRSPDEAGILVRRLEKKGYSPYIQQADLGTKGVWYRVFLGPYASKDKAKAASISLKASEKLDSLVRKK